MHRIESQPEPPKKHTSSKYEQYIAEDYDRHRVFVETEQFMRRALHVPDNWRELWGSTIEKVKNYEPFSDAQKLYTDLCGTPSILETTLYQPLVDMANAIFHVTELPESDESVKPRTPLRYLRNDPEKLLGGMMPELSPDIVAVHKDFFSHLPRNEREAHQLKESRLTWAQPLQILEVKPSGTTLISGSCMPRLKTEGERAMADGIEVLH
jgi:hypothetical protein